MEDKDIYILAEEANTYDTPNRSIEAGIFTDAFIKGYKKASEWISVDESLPKQRLNQDESEYVLAYSDKGDMLFISRYCYYFEGWEYEKGIQQILHPITHWKALPPKP